MIKDMIVKLRSIADSLEEVMNELNSISVPPSGQVAIPSEREWFAKDEQGLGKSLVMPPAVQELSTVKEIVTSGTPIKTPNYELFRQKWVDTNPDQEENRFKRTKLHWTQLPHNRKKLRRVIKIMQQARLNRKK